MIHFSRPFKGLENTESFHTGAKSWETLPLWTSWPWNDADLRYALWEVAPEVRWYLSEKKRGYIGALYKAGQFNYKLSATGKHCGMDCNDGRQRRRLFL